MTSLADRLRGVLRPAQSRHGTLRIRERSAIVRGRSSRVGLRDDAGPRSSAASGASAHGRTVPRRRSEVRARLSARTRRDRRLPAAVTTAGRVRSARRRDGPPRRTGLLFLDLETTGLAGGAGTTRSSSAAAGSTAATFRMRQFFLSSFARRARAARSGGRASPASVAAVVTYNGKSFDLPLIETRFVLHRMTTPFADLPHVDMLHPARRLWRRR